MKKKYIVRGTIALAVVGLIGVTIFSANAASNERAKFTRGNFHQNLTTDQQVNRAEFRNEHRAEMVEHREAARTAMDHSDYNAWKLAAGDHNPFADKINENNFPKLVEAHNLMQAGDRDGAREIMESLGVERPGFSGHQGQHDRHNNGGQMGFMMNQNR